MTIAPLYKLLAMFAHNPDAISALSDGLPSGAGFDAGTTIDKASPKRIDMHTSFHEMREGLYCGWYDYKVRVTADLLGLIVQVNGKNADGLKDYVQEVMLDCLSTEYDLQYIDGRYIAIPV